MATYICESCNRKFAAEDLEWAEVREYHDELDECPVEILHFAYCPNCGSDALDECEGE